MRNCLVILFCSGLAACGFSKEIPPDGPLPTIFVGFEQAGSDADEKSSAHRVKIKLSETSSQSISVKYAIAGGSADPTNDYGIVTMETMVFPPGETEFLLTVAVRSDTVEEGAETIDLQLIDPMNALLAPSADTHEVTILAKALPRVSFMTASADLQEPMDPTMQVVLDEPSEFAITVQYSMTSATATAGSDYTQATGMVTFAPMETTKPLVLDVLDDGLDEDDEPVVVTLDMPTNAFLDDPKKTFTHTILDTLVDPPPTVQFSIGASNISEAGATATIVVNLSAVSGRAITVPFTVAAATTATATTDFTIGTASPLMIPAGTLTTSIVVNVVNDTTDDEAEIVQLDLGVPTNATAGTPAAHALTIDDNDSVCFGPANSAFDVCFTTTPPVNAVNLGGGAINTNAGSGDCDAALAIDFGPNQDTACFIVGSSITVNGAYTVTGTRPLVLVAIGNITVNNMIDASSKQSGAQGPGSGLATCTNGTNGQADTQGGGGAAGASFMSAGNNGGTGDNGDANAGVAALADANPPTKLRGGCTGMKGGNGGGGNGGRGGGAVYLVAGGDITTGPNGGINVSGAGGNGGGTNDGGGGGGTGGMIMFYAAGTFAPNNNSKLVANGGGGGGGGDNGAAGGAGSDPVAATETTPAGGGSSGGTGTGGGGFAGATAAAVGNNGNSNQGGGGGGGGGGYIRSNQTFGMADVSAGSIQVVP